MPNKNRKTNGVKKIDARPQGPHSRQVTTATVGNDYNGRSRLQRRVKNAMFMVAEPDNDLSIEKNRREVKRNDSHKKQSNFS